MSKKFEPQHKAMAPEELEALRGQKMHITIDKTTGYQLRHTSARMGILKKMSYDQIIQLLILAFNKGSWKNAMEDQRAKTIIEE